MYSTLLSIDGRAARRVSIALIGAMTLAACDADRATSPVPSAPSASLPANSAVTPTGKGDLLIRAYDPGATQLLGGAAYKLIGPGFITATVVDGGAYDSDNKVGTVLLHNVPMGNYYVCQTTAPTGYELATLPCTWWTVYSGSTAAANYFSVPLMSASWNIEDGFGYLIGPSTFTLTAQRGLIKITVVDNGQNDLEPELGHITVKLPVATVYTLCETVPPPNRYNANPACVTADDTSGRGIWVGTFVNQEQQVFKP